WICFVTSLTLLIFICLMFRKLLKLKNLSIVLMFVQIVFNQPINKTTVRSILINFPVAIWILSCLVLATIYGGSLHSHMSLQRGQKVIETIADLRQAQIDGQIQVIMGKSG